MTPTQVKSATPYTIDHNTQTVQIRGPLRVGNVDLHPEVVEFATFMYDNMHLAPELQSAWFAHRTKKKLLR